MCIRISSITVHKNLSLGDTIKTESSVYKLNEYLGRGGYGKVFKSIDLKNHRYVAVKLQKYTNSWIETQTWDEIKVYQEISQTKSSHFCKLFDYGILEPENMYQTTYIVLTLLGPDLNKLHKQFPSKHFSLSTAIRVGIQTLKAISELHHIGYLLRGVKPHNFAIGTIEYGTPRKIFMFDFGLAVRYKDKETGELLKMQTERFVGTPFYVSIRVHMGQEYARRDDLESWFYMLVQLTRGSPFKFPSEVKEKLKKPPTKKEQEIVLRSFCEQKFQMRLNTESFLANCPKSYTSIMTIIDDMQSTASVPPYDYIIELLEKCCKENGITENDEYDWERIELARISSSTTLDND